jgi:peptidoglycan/LPS O-acetylase OafA/YrhL
LLSYSLYLSHKAIIHLTQELFGKWGLNKEGNLMAVLCVITCLLAAVLLHIAIEKPFMKWRDQILARNTFRTKKPLVEAA